MAQKQNDEWTLLSEQPVIENGYPGEWNDSGVKDPYVLFEDQDGSYIMHVWFSGFDGSNWRVGYMQSEALLSDDDSSSVLSAFSLPFVHPQISHRKNSFWTWSVFHTASTSLPYEVPQICLSYGVHRRNLRSSISIFFSEYTTKYLNWSWCLINTKIGSATKV